MQVGDLVTSQRYADDVKRWPNTAGMAGIVVKTGWGYIEEGAPCYRVKWNVGYERIFWHQRRDLELLNGT